MYVFNFQLYVLIFIYVVTYIYSCIIIMLYVSNHVFISAKCLLLYILCFSVNYRFMSSLYGFMFSVYFFWIFFLGNVSCYRYRGWGHPSFLKGEGSVVFLAGTILRRYSICLSLFPLVAMTSQSPCC